MIDSNYYLKKNKISVIESSLNYKQTSQNEVTNFFLKVLNKTKLSQTDLDQIQKYVKRYEITKNVFSIDLISSNNDFINYNMKLFIAVVLKCINQNTQKKKNNPSDLKLFNVLFKLIDKYPFEQSEDQNITLKYLRELLENTIKKTKNNNKIHISKFETGNLNLNKTIPLNFLFFEGPIGRAYLQIFEYLNIRPNKIIHLIPSHDTVTKNNIGFFLPEGLRFKYAAFIHKKRINFWPLKILNENYKLCIESFKEIEDNFGIKEDSILKSYEYKKLSNFSDNIEKISFKSFHDQNIKNYFKNLSNETFLFSGGGILPKNIVKNRNIKFIHIHPGYLPKIRGADGFFWSSLIYGKPSSSCFYMDSGIDTGNIISAYWYNQFKIIKKIKNFNKQFIYRFVYSFIDPWIRANHLKLILQENKSCFFNFKSSVQNCKHDLVFHFMHSELRKYIS